MSEDVTLTKRSFLLGLIAAAVATQLPAMPAPASAALIDDLTDKLSGIIANGRPPTSIKIEDVGTGWLRVDMTLADGYGGLSLDFSALNGGRGLVCCGPEYLEECEREYPGGVISSGVTVEEGGASMGFYVRKLEGVI